jgi:hypothetical protein
MDVTKLKNPAALSLYQHDISTSFSSIPDPSCLEDHWSSISGTLNLVGSRVLGISQRNFEPWISANSLKILEDRRTIPTDVCYDHIRRNLRRQLSTSLKNDRETWWKKQAEDMENAWAIGDSRRLFRLIRSVSYPHTVVSETVCETNGDLITNLQRRMDRWSEHFSSQFNWPPATNIQVVTTHTEWAVSTEPPTEIEIREAAKSFKDFKTPGEDNIPAELIKCGGDSLFAELEKLFNEIWIQETVPVPWTRSIVVPIYKKGQRTDCSNHRGISLIASVSKLLATVILRRLSSAREQEAREEQAGFRSGRGCIDQLFTLRLILEHRRTYFRPTIVVFLDIKAAFDAVDRNALWHCLLRNGVPTKFVNILKALYTNTQGRVRVYNEISSNFEITSGVRQGCPISPFLFNFVIDDIIKNALITCHEGGIELLPGRKLFDLEYADDIVAIGENPQMLQHFLENLTNETEKYGLKFSPAKCKAVVQNWDFPSPTLTLAGAPIEFVENFTYLGSQISSNGDMTTEIQSRISKARAAFCRLRHLWRRRDISLLLKGRVYNTTVRAVLLYGCESWTLRRDDIRRLSAFDHHCLRSIARVWWQQHINNAEVRRRVLNNEVHTEIHQVITSHQLRWFGHVLRMQHQRLPRRALFALPGIGWKKRRGGQFLCWTQAMKRITAPLASVGAVRLPGWGPRDNNSLWLETLEEMARDRNQWKNCCRFLLDAT